MKDYSQLGRITEKEQQAAKDFLEKVRQRFDGQLLSAVLFGSRARGEAEPDSDMDILVVMASDDLKTREEIRYLAVEVLLDHDIYLSTRVWSEAHWHELARLQTELYRNICRDGIDILELAA